MAKKRVTRKPKPETGTGNVYSFEGTNLILSKTKSLGCDGCFFDRAGRCLIGDESLKNEFDCTINAGDEIFIEI
jgi:hypothetical protein